MLSSQQPWDWFHLRELCMGLWPPSRRRNSQLMKDFRRKGHIMFTAGATSKGQCLSCPWGSSGQHRPPPTELPRALLRQWLGAARAGVTTGPCALGLPCFNTESLAPQEPLGSEQARRRLPSLGLGLVLFPRERGTGSNTVYPTLHYQRHF